MGISGKRAENRRLHIYYQCPACCSEGRNECLALVFYETNKSPIRTEETVVNLQLFIYLKLLSTL